MIAEAIIRGAAVAGIAILWVDFTKKTIEICRQILFPPKQIHLSRCEYCGIYFPSDDNSRRWVLCQAVFVCDKCAKKEVVCERCHHPFLDDTEELGLEEIL